MPVEGNTNESLNDKVYQKIKNDIMHLVLKPGTAVSVQKLADTYGSSRTPVRESIVRLQQEGLVIIYPQARTNISKISFNRINEECFIRRSLEVSMVDSFIKNCGTLETDTLENINAIMRRAIKRGNTAEFLSTDSRFHRMMLEIAGQYLACDFIESSNTHYNRLRFLSIMHGRFNNDDIDEHEEIIETAKKRDSDGMKAAITKHLKEGKYQIRELQKVYPHYFA